MIGKNMGYFGWSHCHEKNLFFYNKFKKLQNKVKFSNEHNNLLKNLLLNSFMKPTKI
jgi:hypothetical protein